MRPAYSNVKNVILFTIVFVSIYIKREKFPIIASNKFNKITIVADSSVWKWLIKVDCVGIDKKYFDIKEAWVWVRR